MINLGHAPGPSGIPIVGVWPGFRRDPIGFLKHVACTYGDISSFRLAGQRVYFVNRPDLIEEVLVHSSSYFERVTTLGGVRLANDIDAEAGVDPASAAEASAVRAGTALQRWLGDGTRLTGGTQLQPITHLPVSGTVLWNALRLLSQHQGAMRRLRSELNDRLQGRAPAPADVPHLDYTAHVIAETLRLHPPVWAVGRVAKRECRLFNFLLQTGTVCVASPEVTHRNSALWPNPEAFDPDRFEEARERSRSEYAFFPFGVTGAKASSLESLCWLETVLVLATMCQNAEFRPDTSSSDTISITTC